MIFLNKPCRYNGAELDGRQGNLIVTVAPDLMTAATSHLLITVIPQYPLEVSHLKLSHHNAPPCIILICAPCFEALFRDLLTSVYQRKNGKSIEKAAKIAARRALSILLYSALRKAPKAAKNCPLLRAATEL